MSIWLPRSRQGTKRVRFPPQVQAPQSRGHHSVRVGSQTLLHDFVANLPSASVEAYPSTQPPLHQRQPSVLSHVWQPCTVKAPQVQGQSPAWGLMMVPHTFVVIFPFAHLPPKLEA